MIDEIPPPVSPESLGVHFLYLDDSLVVVNKPSGMLVHRTHSAHDPTVVMTVVRDALYRYVHCVHRLDRETSGALLLVLDKTIVPQFNEMFRDARVHKSYLALVCGEVPLEGSIEFPLVKHNGTVLEAVTTFVRLGTADDVSLVEVTPHQGRLHQIRRHFQMLGHPLLGDPQYGDPAATERAAHRYGLGRMALHAHRLGFTHPISGANLRINAPLPEDLREPLLAAGLEPGAWMDQTAPHR